jgi:hypothetical protein
MSFHRVSRVLFVVCGAVASSSACQEGESVVAVNINSTDEVGNPSALVVTITQAGQAPVEREIKPPTRTQDSGVSIKPMFFERVQLPDSWEHAKAEVKVDAKDARGVYLSAMTEITVRPGGAVAAFVDLGKKPEMKMDAGVAGMGGAGTAGSGDEDAGP